MSINKPLTEFAEHSIRILTNTGKYSQVQQISVSETALHFNATDTSLERVVFIKVFLQADDAQREFSFYRKIKHASIPVLLNVLPFTAPDKSEENLALVLDYAGSALLEQSLAAVVSGSTNQGLEKGCQFLVQAISEFAQALSHLHENDIVHGDISAANIICDAKGKVWLTDFSSALPVGTRYEQTNAKRTPRFAHNDFFSKDISQLIASFRYDIFSLGKVLLSLLNIIREAYPDQTVLNYQFNYLHLMACRMLDGKNTQVLSGEKSGKGMPEIWRELRTNFFHDVKYTHINDIIFDLRKLANLSVIYHEIPELADSSGVLVSHEGNAPFSERVQRIVRHPVFARLRHAQQIELIDSIYPSANHNRFEHSLGVFRNACLYVKALLEDSGNPLFRLLVSLDDLKSVMLGALLHDLGQHPFAHTLEEIIPDYRHEYFTLAFLENTTADNQGNTLKEIIESKDFGWGIPVTAIKHLLDIQAKAARTTGLFRESHAVHRMLASIIDGPIDTDKLDYLRRDSHKSLLPYGNGIDVQRLLQGLTIVPYTENGYETLTLGVHENCQTAAESLSFARYAMYQSVYWHHSSRSLRAMVKEAVFGILQKSANKKGKSLFKDIAEFLGAHGVPAEINVKDMLHYLYEKADIAGKELLDLVRQRRYYRKLLSIRKNQYEQLPLDKFRKAARSAEFRKGLQLALKDQFIEFLRGKSEPAISLLAPDYTSPALAMLEKPGMILCDAPSPSFGSAEKLRYLPETRFLRRNYVAIEDSGARVSDVWEYIHRDLMDISAKARIYAHPHIADTLLTALGPEMVAQVTAQCLQKYN